MHSNQKPSRIEEANHYESLQNGEIIDEIRIESLSVAAALSSTKHEENANFSIRH